MRRRPKPSEQRLLPPTWIRQTLPGLIRFDGDLDAWRAARADWCRRNGCYRRPRTCVEVFGKNCPARREVRDAA
jgi:hypothetical protein